MQRIRIVELPAVRAACSGPLTDEARFARFNDWFSRYHAAQPCELYPRDFMWYNERLGAQEWFYALPAGADERDTEGFPVVTLPHGLFAVAPCLDADLDGAADWMRTRDRLGAGQRAVQAVRERRGASGALSDVPHRLAGAADPGGRVDRGPVSAD